ncbi:MAG: type II toxin-antitoxin system PemK/MazF family toxin [Methanoculleus sp.]|nr:type II toxin-antitoxin system PemK/MazF family toxin [Methanoculleus sp.]
MKGKVVLIPFPFTDLTSSKLRPALVLYEGRHDLILAFISSQTRPQTTEAEIHVRKDMPGFETSGLKVDSVIRLDKVATVLKDLVIAELGELDTHCRESVNQKLCALFHI